MEHILLVGTNFRHASLPVREQIAFAAATLPDLLTTLHRDLAEIVILSTCNRTEIYAVAGDIALAQARLRDAITTRAESLAPCLYVKLDRETTRHLFSVAAGLDSMIPGEFEILGQVRAAYELAADQKTVGPILAALFQAAIHAGKRARSETAIGRGTASAAYAAVQMARRRLGTLQNRRVLVIGAGIMGQRVAKNLRAQGTSAIIVANRTFDHAIALARELGGTAIQFDGLDAALAEADVVISATGAPHLILDRARLARAMAARPARPLCIIDIAVPRDVDPAARQIPELHLFDLDDLQVIVRDNLAEREKQTAQVRAIVEAEVAGFWNWYLERRAAPVIRDLHARAETIRRAELDKGLRRLEHLSARDRQIVEALSASMLNKFLATPTQHLKECALADDGQVYLDALRELFELPEETPQSSCANLQPEPSAPR
jgi:glutamyl-tRNA reductase